METATAKAILEALLRLAKAAGKDENGKFNAGKMLLVILSLIIAPLILIIAVIVFVISLPFGAIVQLALPEDINVSNVFPSNIYYSQYGDWPMPCNSNVIYSEFGTRDNPLNPGTSEEHTGLDFGATPHSPVTAIADGTVIFAGYKPHYGRCVVINYGVFSAYYGHLSKAYAIRGSNVTKGTVIGQVGGDKEVDTLAGDSTGAHLHFEIRVGSRAVDPYPYLFEYRGLNPENEEEAEDDTEFTDGFDNARIDGAKIE